MNEKEIPEMPPGSYNVNQDGIVQDGEFAGREVRGYGLRAQDFNGHTPYPTDARLRAPEHQQPNPADMPPVRVARDKAVYTRQQKGHSWLLHWCVLGIFTLWIVPIYYSFSPNHYWHI